MTIRHIRKPGFRDIFMVKRKKRTLASFSTLSAARRFVRNKAANANAVRKS